MGIAVQELLANEFFKDFQVIAGRKGLGREIQGITSLEAPDGYKWTKGKELVMSSGYAISQEPGCIENAFAEGSIQKTSALMIKLGRHLERIPDSIIRLCDEHDLPLISVPFSVTWMDIIRQTNVAVLNRTIRRFRVPDSGGRLITNQTYMEQKVRRILQAVESEMRFPACLHDIAKDRSLYSSSDFIRMTENCGLSESDYWEPSLPYTRHTLCDYINMTRYRLIGTEDPDEPRVSWIIIPIKLYGVTQAYFIVMESRGLMDYYDEYAVRIAYLMLQSLYEQAGGAREAGYLGFESFIHFAMSCSDEEESKLMGQAGMQGISMSMPYDYGILRLSASGANESREQIMSAFTHSRCSRFSKLALLDDRDLLLLMEQPDKGRRSAEEAAGLAEELMRRLGETLGDESITAAISRDGKTLRDIRSCVGKCRRILDMGRVAMPQRTVWDYEMLGPLAWLDIPEDELEHMLGRFRSLQKDEKGREMLRTLRIYLENNMNYSVTSEMMYVHINTIRKRIDRVSSALDTDWSDPVERIRTILLLQLLEAE